jgi:hypothetical protein
LPTTPTFQHNKVVKSPVENAWNLEITEFRAFDRVTLATDAVGCSRGSQLQGTAAIAADPAHSPSFLNGNVPPVKSKH